MPSNQFDNLSKNLARAVSRRQAVEYIFSALIGSTLASKVFGQQRTPAAVCPSCGTCQTCNSDNAKCQPTCSNACLAAALCQEANNNAPFTSVKQSILNLGFRQIGDPTAVDSTGTGLAPAQLLEFKYVKRQVRTFARPRFFEETASLFYYKPMQGTSQAKAVVRKNGNLSYVLYLNSQNVVTRFYGPYYNDYNLNYLRPAKSSFNSSSINKQVTGYENNQNLVTLQAELNTFNHPVDQCTVSCTATCAFASSLGCIPAGFLYCAGEPNCMASFDIYCGGTSVVACFAVCNRKCNQCNRNAGLEVCFDTCYDPARNHCCVDPFSNPPRGITACPLGYQCFSASDPNRTLCRYDDYTGICTSHVNGYTQYTFCPSVYTRCGVNPGVCCDDRACGSGYPTG